MKDLQAAVQAELDERVEKGVERGVQVAVYHEGEQVVDAVAGLADADSGRPVTPDTLFFSFSTAKVLTATVVNLVVDRGLLDYDTPVAEVWPEFAANGKQGVTLRHLLTHTSGLPAVPAETQFALLTDWDGMTGALAAAAPWWEPGTQTGYHALTFGFLLGEVVRRVTGRPIEEVLREEVAAPLGVADELFLAVPPSEQPRMATAEQDAETAAFLDGLPPDADFFRLVPKAVTVDAAFANRADVRGANIGGGGTVSARALARLYAALVGEVDGVRLLPAERVDTMASPAYTGEDTVMGGGTAIWGLGWVIGRPGAFDDPDSTSFAWEGAGGSGGFGDRARRLGVGVTKNRFAYEEDGTLQAITRMVMQATA
jgi:CubicO group peptidase (beta-lactamase class C family)